MGALLQISKEDVAKMEKSEAAVNSHLAIHVGDILFGDSPIKVLMNNKEYFKVSVKGKYEGKIYTYGYMFVDCETLAIDENLSDSREKIHRAAEELTGYDGTII